MTCFGNTPAGFQAGTDALKVTVLPGAAVGANAAPLGIGVMGRSEVLNHGAVTVSPFGTGISALGVDDNLVNFAGITAGDHGVGMQGSGSSNIVNRGLIAVGRNSAGLYGLGSGNQLVNVGGIIVGEGGSGSLVQGDGHSLVNAGIIFGSAFARGLAGLGDRNTFVNSGLIDVGVGGVGIRSQGVGSTIVNAGTILVGDCGIGIDTSPGSGASVENKGTIVGTGCASGVRLGNGDTLTNSGLISAPFSVSATSSGTITVTNTGTLDGALALGGSGGNTLTNSGLVTVSTTLAAGGGVNHVIDGTFTQSASGTFATRVMSGNATGNYDTLKVAGSVRGTGVANLGGTLRPVAQPGLYGATTIYSGVLTFARSTGRFASVASPSIFLDASAIYHPGSVDLVLTRVPFNQLAGGANTRAIGNVLEANYATDLGQPLASFYSQLVLSTAPDTLSQLTGEIVTAPQDAAYVAVAQFLDAMSRRTSGVQKGNGRRAMAAEACRGGACDDRASRRFTAWAQGFGGSGSIDGNDNIGSSRVEITAGGGAVGIDTEVGSNVLVGISLGATSAGYEIEALSSAGTMRSIVFGLYGGYAQGPAYLNAAIAFGYSAFNSNRVIATGTLGEIAAASFDGFQSGGRAEAGWHFAFGPTVLTPFAGFTVQALTQPGYSETSKVIATGAPGMLGVTVQGQTTASVRSTLGGQFETAIWTDDDYVLRPKLRLGWTHAFDTNRSATVTLGSLLPGMPFQVTGARPAPDALLVSAGFDFELDHNVHLYGRFDGEFSSNARGLSGTGGLRFVW